MKSRCYCKTAHNYHIYGARGISVCPEWREDYLVFKKWALENGYAKGLSIDRIDNNGNYEPSNCRWATVKTQGNNRNYCIIVEYGGIKATIAQWADKTGLPYTTLLERYRKGWSPEKMMTTPKRIYTRRSHAA